METETDDVAIYCGSLQTQRFRNLSTCKAATFHLIAALLVEIVAIIFVIPSNGYITKCNFLCLLIFAQSGLWFLSLILDHYYKWRHRFLRLDGHFEFYEKMTNYATKLFYIISFWNAILLICIGIFYNLFQSFDKICTETEILSPVNILSLVISLQAIMLVPINITYILCVYSFNKTCPVPDIEKRECWGLEDSVVEEAGYHLNGEPVADFLQKQADLIYYYKCLNNVLQAKIMELSSQLRDERVTE